MDQVKSIYDQEMRRRRLQEALMQQAMTPQGTQYTGGPYSRAVPYSPLQGLTSIGQALIARSGMKEGEDRIKSAIEEQEAKRKRLAESVMQTYQGTPAVPEETAPLLGPDTFPEGQQVLQEAVPAVPGDPQAAMLQAAANPETERMATILAGLEKAKGGRGAYSTPIKMFNPEKNKEEWYSFDTRAPAGAQRVSPINIPGVETPTSPSAKGAVKAAETTAKLTSEREYGMENLKEQISEAEKILNYGDPTASGFGAAVDAANRYMGITTDSAQQASKLEAIGGALTGSMPRFEGPQSDYDREYYQQMAGRVGDRSVPIAERKKALEAVKAIWGKYDKTAPESLYIEVRQTPKGFIGKKKDGTLELISGSQ